MSADTRPISPARFASALKELSLPMLHLKVLEIRNSIAHLQYSNDQLRPFAEGSSVASSSPSTTTANGTAEAPATSGAAPDQDCIDAIAENLQVIDRMVERIALVRSEVEERGVSWTEFEQVKPSEEQASARTTVDETTPSATGADVNGTTTNGAAQSSPWTDGTFQTGVIRNGEVHMDANPGERWRQAEPEGAGGQGVGQGGGSLTDEQLRRAMEERLRNLGADDDEEGMHL